MATCFKWGSTPIMWVQANWWWSLCSGGPTPPTPVSASVVGGVDATALVQPWITEPWNPYTAADEHDKKRKKLIKLMCKLKGVEYNEEKQFKDLKLTVEDVQFITKASEVEIDLKLEE